MFSYRQVYIFYHAHFEPLLNQKLPCNELVGVFGCFCTTVLHCCWISKSGPKMVKKRVNRFTRVLQFSGNNYFSLKTHIFLQKREKDRFSAAPRLMPLCFIYVGMCKFLGQTLIKKNISTNWRTRVNRFTRVLTILVADFEIQQQCNTAL